MVAKKQTRYMRERERIKCARREKERDTAQFVGRFNSLSETETALDVSLEWRGRDDYNCVKRGSSEMKNEVARSPAHRVGESETRGDEMRDTEVTYCRQKDKMRRERREERWWRRRKKKCPLSHSLS